MTAGGIWRLDDLLLGIYEKEARFFARGSKLAARRSVHSFRVMHDMSWRVGSPKAWLTGLKDRAQQWRRPSSNNESPINDDEAAALDGEVLPPQRTAYKRRA